MQFQNTKSDLGTCPKKYHEEKLKDIFLVEGERYREEYERDFMQFLDKLVYDLERKLRRGKERLDIKPSDPTAALNPANDEFEEKRTILDLQVKEILVKMEACGEEGKIQEAQELMLEAEKYKAELERLRQLEAENPSYRLEKRMEVCQTCGAFLIVGDAQKRIEAHFEGKQHNGWARIRETLTELKRKYAHGARERRTSTDQREPGEIGEIDSWTPNTHDRDREHRRHDRDDRGHNRERDRGYDRDRGRDRRGSREHNRERDHEHNRDHDREHDRDRSHRRR